MTLYHVLFMQELSSNAFGEIWSYVQLLRNVKIMIDNWESHCKKTIPQHGQRFISEVLLLIDVVIFQCYLLFEDVRQLHIECKHLAINKLLQVLWTMWVFAPPMCKHTIERFAIWWLQHITVVLDYVLTSVLFRHSMYPGLLLLSLLQSLLFVCLFAQIFSLVWCWKIQLMIFTIPDVQIYVDVNYLTKPYLVWVCNCVCQQKLPVNKKKAAICF